MEGQNNTNNNDLVTNWNNIIGLEARTIDNADLGKIQGLFEPFLSKWY
jgi:hypothetical protein